MAIGRTKTTISTLDAALIARRSDQNCSVEKKADLLTIIRKGPDLGLAQRHTQCRVIVRKIPGSHERNALSEDRYEPLDRMPEYEYCIWSDLTLGRFAIVDLRIRPIRRIVRPICTHEARLVLVRGRRVKAADSFTRPSPKMMNEFKAHIHGPI
jgi:hypothetical protein